MPVFDNITSLDQVGLGFSLTNNAIDKIVTTATVLNGSLDLGYNDGTFLSVQLPIPSTGTIVLTQNGSIDIAGVDPACTIEAPALDYSYNGNVQSIASTSIAFVAPDPTLDRFDVIAINPDTNTYVYTQGTPDAVPTIPTLAGNESAVAIIYVYGGQPCENSFVTWSAITEQNAEIQSGLNARITELENRNIEDFPTTETDVSFVLNPDGAGGLVWQASAGGAFVFSGVAYVDETAVPVSGVYGDITNPYATIKEAIDAIPANESCRVICLGESPTFGVSGGAIDAIGKSIEIDASGKTLDETELVFVNSGACSVSIKCHNFIFDGNISNPFWSKVFGNTANDAELEIICTDTLTNRTAPIASFGVLRITTRNLISDRWLIQGNDSSLYLDFDDAILTANLHGGGGFASVISRVSCTQTGGSPLFTGLTAGSKITGHYNVPNFCFDSVDTIISHATVTCTAYPFDNDTGLTIEHSDFIVSRRFNGNPLTDLTMKKSTVDCNFDGALSPSYTIVVLGENSITDCIFSGAGVNANGIDSQGTNTDIVESMFIFDAGHYGTWANGNYTDLNDNDVYPRATATLVGTEEIKVKTSAGNYESTTTQDIADLGGGGGVTSAVEVSMSVAQVWVTGVETKIDFDTEANDIGGDFDTTTNIFTAPVDGWYQANITSQGLVAAAGKLSCRIYGNGTLRACGSDRSSLASTLEPSTSAVIYLLATEEIEFRAFQDTGFACTGQIACTFASIIKIG